MDPHGLFRAVALDDHLDLDAEDQEILGSWVKAGIGTKKIAKALTDDGHEIAPGTIFSHLASDCFCDPDHIDDSPYGTRQQGANA